MLPAVPERVSAAALRLLGKIGVEVKTAATVAEVLKDGVRLASGEIIPAELVWVEGLFARLMYTSLYKLH